MDYRSAALSELETISNEFPEYSVGQLFLAVIKRKPEDISISEWLMNVSDEDMYTLIESTKIIERN